MMTKQRTMRSTKRVGAAAARASAFVRTLAAQHAPLRHASPMDVVLLRRAQPLAAVQAMHQHWQFSIAPRLQLMLASSSPARATEPAAAPVFVMPASPANGPTFISQVLEPIRLRNERVDTLRVLQQTLQHAAAAPAQPSSAAPAAAMQAAHIERVFHSTVRGAAASVATPSVPQHAAPPTVTMPPMHPFGPAVPAASAPDLDIGRLADRVVHAIDRRLVAQRERFGRI